MAGAGGLLIEAGLGVGNASYRCAIVAGSASFGNGFSGVGRSKASGAKGELHHGHGEKDRQCDGAVSAQLLVCVHQRLIP